MSAELRVLSEELWKNSSLRSEIIFNLLFEQREKSIRNSALCILNSALIRSCSDSRAKSHIFRPYLKDI